MKLFISQPLQGRGQCFCFGRRSALLTLAYIIALLQASGEIHITDLLLSFTVGIFYSLKLIVGSDACSSELILALAT